MAYVNNSSELELIGQINDGKQEIPADWLNETIEVTTRACQLPIKWLLHSCHHRPDSTIVGYNSFLSIKQSSASYLGEPPANNRSRISTRISRFECANNKASHLWQPGDASDRLITFNHTNSLIQLIWLIDECLNPTDSELASRFIGFQFVDAPSQMDEVRSEEWK